MKWLVWRRYENSSTYKLEKSIQQLSLLIGKMPNSELLDIVDENDNVIGQATREECHADPKLLHRTVHFTLIDRKNKKIFLTQRSWKKEHDAGKLCFLGEHLISGEKYENAVIRGVKEELGVDLSTTQELAQNIFAYQSQRELVRFFLVDWNGKDINFDPEEVEQIIWLEVDELIQRKNDYSEMTRYWIENVDWAKV